MLFGGIKANSFIRAMTTLKALKISCQFAAVAWLSSWYYSYELERERQTRSLQQLPSLRSAKIFFKTNFLLLHFV